MDVIGSRKMYQLVLASLIAVLAVPSFADVDVKLFDYSAETLKTSLEINAQFVLLYTDPACEECEAARTIIHELMMIFNTVEKRTLTVAELDCSKNTDYCAELEVDSFPTFYYLHGDEKKVKYIGDVVKDDLIMFIAGQLSKKKVVNEVVVNDVLVNDGLYEPTADNFKSFIAEGNHFIKFYAPWCGHCKKLAPTWDDLAKGFVDSTDVKISKIDCTKSQATCKEYGIGGYPTLKFFSAGEEVTKYSGNRGLEALKTFVSEEVAKKAGPPAEEEAVEPEEAKSAVVDLTDEDFAEAISSGNTFVKFYAPWCGHCKMLAPIWEELGEAVADDEGITIAKVDCTLFKEICTENGVKGYPTLYLFKDGERQEKYSKPRNLESLKSYLTGEFQKDEL